ncbi:phage distal tail protein [Tepidibacillus sp. LV47]|uniref:phage distal tail protein n=1 Tax=Tepidibacillus sp. LV47 TaxID=3398228 RepID=UPI003AAE8681
MLVNSIDISNFKAKLLKKDIQTAEVVVYDDWLRNALNPLYLCKQEKYKQINLELFIKDTDDESALNDISNLVKQFEKCTIKFDDLNFYYDCLIVNKTHKRATKGIYTLDIELKSGYAYKPEVVETLDHVTSKTLNVSGNLRTPAIVEITPTIDMAEITVAGMKVKNLTANTKVIINSEDFTVLEGTANKYGDTEGDFPFLVPGSNTITVSDANCVVYVKYKPRWL